MALRDHTLDEKIADAARQEFLEKGYTGASLRKIAEKADVTVGAIQTRYPSKDALFASLLRSLLAKIETAFQNIKTDYYADAGEDFLCSLKASMQHESEAILDLIFAHYEEAVLLFRCSTGSSMETYFDGLVKQKCRESILFFAHAGYSDIDEKLLELLSSVQFDSYRRIVSDCPEQQTAERSMQALMTYHYGGWAAFFDGIKQEQEADAR